MAPLHFTIDDFNKSSFTIQTSRTAQITNHSNEQTLNSVWFFDKTEKAQLITLASKYILHRVVLVAGWMKVPCNQIPVSLPPALPSSLPTPTPTPTPLSVRVTEWVKWLTEAEGESPVTYLFFFSPPSEWVSERVYHHQYHHQRCFAPLAKRKPPKKLNRDSQREGKFLCSNMYNVNFES